MGIESKKLYQLLIGTQHIIGSYIVALCNLVGLVYARIRV
jgi:hypothetical protein